MKVSTLSVLQMLLLMTLPAVAFQASAPAPQAAVVERVAGTFELSGKSWTVVLRGKSASDANDPFATPDDWVQSFEIRDTANQTVFGNYDLSPVEVSAGAQLIEGRTGKGIVVTWGLEISAPGSCSWYQFFTVKNDHVVPLSGPICEAVEFGKFGPDKIVLKYDEQGHFDYFDTIDHVDFFDVIIPVQVNFLDARLMGGHLTVIPHHPPGDWCAVPVRADRAQVSDKETFVRLFSEPGAPGALPRRVAVKPDSKVQFLSAGGRCTVDDSGQPTGIDLRERPWLQINVDGQTGWIHDESDLTAVGLVVTG